jgi:hypothetical protein
MKTIKVGLLGLGNIGTGTYKTLEMNRKQIESNTGVSIEITKILEKDVSRKRDITVSMNQFTQNPDDIFLDPEIDIVIELLGGVEPASSFMLKALENKKHVVTANKAAVAANFDAFMDAVFTPQNLKEFEGFIVVSYKQRVLQIATLKIPIIENESKLSPSDSISLTNQALLYRLEDGEKRAKVDLSLITNKTAELTMILPSSAFQYKLDNCKDITISINEKISQIANSEEDYENGYESKKGQQY